ncbi:hypothetical protein [Granulicella tundricola]|uniref:Uncharacterized protein n=1 Tax=Granulicella tundricola (strain ATCC BAA-1859 / DSM 23138 / MP5ACTX9) TaxID=1198114 RepID=E8WY14_GRATM|nr:hypothetical protein [Granulicella tundricola]ADW67553.1 hypothetical protein AciX9_0481 [Granulicella tundricola MP5ACTX9]
MDADWSAECGTDDPVLVVPWSGDSSDPTNPQPLQFIDLRENPYDLDQIQEAEHHPALLQALRALNAGRSPVFTAKCDAWPLSPEELEHLALTLATEPVESAHGFASYIDLIWRERSLFVSRHRHEQLLDSLIRSAEPLDLPHAVLECIVRPALVDLTGPQEGFAVTLYLKALGPDATSAYANWAEALESAVALIRNSDRTNPRSKAR